MRFCGDFGRFQKVARTENRPQANSLARQGVRAALLAVDDADRRSDDQTDLTQRLNRLEQGPAGGDDILDETQDRKSTRLNSSHVSISYAVFCLKKKKY